MPKAWPTELVDCLCLLCVPRPILLVLHCRRRSRCPWPRPSQRCWWSSVFSLSDHVKMAGIHVNSQLCSVWDRNQEAWLWAQWSPSTGDPVPGGSVTGWLKIKILGNWLLWAWRCSDLWPQGAFQRLFCPDALNEAHCVVCLLCLFIAMRWNPGELFGSRECCCF